MCGICCVCHLVPASDATSCQFVDMGYVESHSFIPRRGPDVQRGLTLKLWSSVQTLFSGFVLHLRGTVTPQPLTNGDGDILLWNGEIFDGIKVRDDENDTQVLLQQLRHCESQLDILTVLQSVCGPWSFIFWQARAERLWFGRDVFGRRSLLWHLPQDDGVFALSSVPIKPLDFVEVPSVGVFCMELSSQSWDNQDVNHRKNTQHSSHLPFSLHLYPWQRATWPGTEQEVMADEPHTVAEKLRLDLSAYIGVNVHQDQAVDSWMPVLNSEVPDDGSLLSVEDCMSRGSDLVHVLTEIQRHGRLTALVTQLQDVLQTAVQKRAHNLPRPCSQQGNVGSAGDLQACCDSEKLDQNCEHSSLDACSNFQLQGVSSALHSVSSGSSENMHSTSHWPEAQTDHQPVAPASEGQTERTVLPSCDTDSLLVSSGEKKPLSEHREGTSGTSERPYAAVTNADMATTPSQTSVKPANIAILFSGGVDSTVLAALADRCVPAEESIDLINVAFEQKVSASQSNRNRGNQAKHAATTSHYDVPDRQTGYLALSELNPHRCWNFVEVNVTQEMLQTQRSEHVRHLVYPLNTVLDDSIGCAVWFAAQGRGVLGNGPSKGTAYTSAAKVILCGMGADEQLAGYSRHRVRFQQESWSGLVSEVNMEIHRISARNLGRDDRIIADHGKESRFPFLDEDVVAFLASVPIHHKADLRFPRGVGEKLLLRLLALQLGLPCTSALPKRAIQFGSRIAKLEQSKEKGSHVCQRLMQE